MFRRGSLQEHQADHRSPAPHPLRPTTITAYRPTAEDPTIRHQYSNPRRMGAFHCAGVLLESIGWESAVRSDSPSAADSCSGRAPSGLARPFPARLFYGCSYMFHLSGDNSRDQGSATAGYTSTDQQQWPDSDVKAIVTRQPMPLPSSSWSRHRTRFVMPGLSWRSPGPAADWLSGCPRTIRLFYGCSHASPVRR